MAIDKLRTLRDDQRQPSVLDAPENIEGVPTSEDDKSKSRSRKREDCDSVLDAPECIDGVDNPKRKRARPRK